MQSLFCRAIQLYNDVGLQLDFSLKKSLGSVLADSGKLVSHPSPFGCLLVERTDV